MISSLPNKLLCCPLCQGKWTQVYEDKWTLTYTCVNLCQIEYAIARKGEHFGLHRKLINGIRISWWHKHNCEIKFDDRIINLETPLPLNIDFERVKLLILMS